MYGESQVGKSYLVSSLLSERGRPFSITDEHNIVHHFIKDINPRGEGSESTGLISRFSTNYKPEFPKYPIKANLLTPTDIVLLLGDSFYSNIKVDHDKALSPEQLKAELMQLKARFEDLPEAQNHIVYDDVLDILDYFKEHFAMKAGALLHTNYFEQVANWISKVKPSDWIDVFSLMWNRNREFTALYRLIINEYEKLGFASTVYLPVDAVLARFGTLLDVKRLGELYLDAERTQEGHKADVTIWSGKKELNCPKSYLSLLTAELVFSQPDNLLESKPFLRQMDLLDMPGLRGPMSVPYDRINHREVPQLLIRGKVNYLFNKYAHAQKITALMLCAKHTMVSEFAISGLIDKWVNKYIGKTPEEREHFINYSRVAPLFIIGTFFNSNLEYNHLQDKPDEPASLNYRWDQRFISTLSKELISTEQNKWFHNWTTSERYFKNNYLLRDFVYSEMTSQIFTGFRQYGEEREEVVPPDFPDLRIKLRQSFLEHEFVKNHFENPEMAWDEAASINLDGSGLIIRQLSTLSEKIHEARSLQYQELLVRENERLLSVLSEHYNSEDKAEHLLKARTRAGEIQANLAVAFGRDPYFFGRLMKELLLDSSEVYSIFLCKIRDIERRDVVNLDQYIAIRMAVPKLDSNLSFDENLRELQKHYEQRTPEECKSYFEQQLKINLEELFFGNNDRVKIFAETLVEALEEYWFESFVQSKRSKLNIIFTEQGWEYMLEMLRMLYLKLKVRKILADKIRTHVDGYRNIDNVYEMIADISTEVFNTFINNVGQSCFSDDDWSDIRQANSKGLNQDSNGLGLTLDFEEFDFKTNSKEDAARLITQMGNLSELLQQRPLSDDVKRLPNYRNYILWYHKLKVGFVFVCDIPTYDVQANVKLKQIIDKVQDLSR